MDELSELYKAWNRAWLEKDSEAVERMMAPEYVYISPQGQILDREAIAGIIRSPGYRIVSGSWTEVIVKRIEADFAIILYRWQGEFEFDGKILSDDNRGTSVCARKEGRWQIVHEHCSKI